MYSVLICDDSLVARKQVAKCLPQDWEVGVHFAKHGREAIEALQSGKGQVLLLDLNMPVMDGYETLKAIQKQGLNTKVVVISGDIPLSPAPPYTIYLQAVIGNKLTNLCEMNVTE